MSYGEGDNPSVADVLARCVALRYRHKCCCSRPFNSSFRDSRKAPHSQFPGHVNSISPAPRCAQLRERDVFDLTNIFGRCWSPSTIPVCLRYRVLPDEIATVCLNLNCVLPLDDRSDTILDRAPSSLKAMCPR